MLPTRFTNLTEARRRFGDRVDRLGPYLTRVDPLADEVVDALDSLPASAGWGLFGRLARQGGERVPEAPEALHRFFAEASRVPPWVDWALADRGCEVLVRAGPLGGLVLGLKSLVLAYASPAGNKPLVLSGRLTEQAARRLNETARFVAATITPGGLRPGAAGWQVTLKVRLIHAQVRRMILRSGRWNGAAWGAPINQHDEAGTLLLFSVAVLEGLRHLGLRITRDEAEAYVHLWRWSGWLMGVDPELLPATEHEGLRLGDIIAATQGAPDDDSRALTRALLESSRPKRELGATNGSDNGPRAMRATLVGSTLCRTLIGDALADDLGVPGTRWQRVVPLARGLVSGVDLVRSLVGRVAAPLGALSLRGGRRYWDRVADVGLTDATAEFAVPQRLAPGSEMPRRA